MSRKTIFFSAGGTGGHIFPALAVAQMFESEYNVVWIGASHGLENEIIPKNRIKLETIKISGLRKKGLVKIFSMPFLLTRAFFQALILILKYRPSAIIGFGGYATFPICLMGKLMFTPTLIHEQNAIPGLTNKILAKFVNTVMVAFDGVMPSKKTIVVGNPVRPEIINIEPPEKRYAKRNGGLNILILGGSLGAKIFNDILPEVFSQVDNVTSITHQVGRGDKLAVETAYEKYHVNAHVVNFIDNMADAYANNDLIICRSGASTVSEVAAVGIAAIFVPYPYAVDNHQYFNAKYLEDCAAAEIVMQKDLISGKIVGKIEALNREACLQMAKNCKKCAKVNSTRDIYKIISNFLKK